MKKNGSNVNSRTGLDGDLISVEDNGKRIFTDPTADGSLRVMRLALMSSLSREGERIMHAEKFEKIITNMVDELRRGAEAGGRGVEDLRRRMQKVADYGERAASEV
jgi:hypothetical protein